MRSIKHAKHAKPALHPTRTTLSTGLTAALLPLCMASPAFADGGTTGTASAPATSTVAMEPAAAKPAAATSMRISAPTTAVAAGQHAVGVRLLDAGGAHVAGQVVTVQRWTGSGWTALGRMTTNAEGLAKQPFAFSATTRVRAVFAGSAGRAASVSPEREVRIATPTTMRISGPAGAVTAGSHEIGVRLLADGQYVPSAYVRVEKKTAAGWEYLGKMITDANGLAKQAFSFTTTTSVRAVYEGSATRGSSVSPVQTVSIGDFRTRALQVAAAQRGKPYRWGSTGPSSFDCSGLMVYVFKQVGKNLPRTSGEQLRATQRVSKAAMRPGDLVFTQRDGRVGHVGVYAGDNKFWVAPKAGDVVKLQTIYTSNFLVGRVN